MSEFSLINQILILELADRAACPLSNRQIGDFFAENDLAHYFTVQNTLSELVEKEFLRCEESDTITFYAPTEKAGETLALYRNRLTKTQETAIEHYLKTHDVEIISRYGTKAFYDRAEGGGYLCTLQMSEQNRIILHITLHATSEAAAKTICANWNAKKEDVYAHILDKLLI